MALLALEKELGLIKLFLFFKNNLHRYIKENEINIAFITGIISLT